MSEPRIPVVYPGSTQYPSAMTPREIVEQAKVDKGFRGRQGHQGVQGNQGPQGFTGPIGDPGGAQGYQGFQGDSGFQGTQGFQGRIGDMGPQGRQGRQGFQGDLGNQGFQGSQGVQGNQGKPGVGLPGPQGAPGGGGASVTISYNGQDETVLVKHNLGTYDLVTSFWHVSEDGDEAYYPVLKLVDPHTVVLVFRHLPPAGEYRLNAVRTN